MSDEPVSETIAKLRADDSEHAHIVADKLEEASVGISFYSILFEVPPEKITEAMQEDDDVRRSFNEMVGGFETHTFDLALAKYFPHVKLEGVDENGDIEFEILEPTLLRRIKWRLFG